MKFYKYIFYFSLFFLLSCERDQNRYNGDRYDDNPRDRRIDSRGDFEYGSARDRELSRLKTPSGYIEADIERRFDGGFYYETLDDGERCKDSASCKEICDLKLSRSHRSRCYSAPRAVVIQLEDGIFTLLNISEVNSVDISPGLISGMINMRKQFIVDLIEDRMSEGDLKSFLAWIAVNRVIAEVFLEEDKRSQIVESTFETLGKLQSDSKLYAKTGLNVGLIQNEDSFFYLASVENNVAAFQIAYKVLRSVCKSKDCKMDVLCAREEFNNRRSRIFGNLSRRSLSSNSRTRDFNSLGRCKTSADQKQRASRASLCYIHGAAAWSFLEELIDYEKEIKDDDFTGQENAVSVEKCNDHCGGSKISGDTESDKCRRIQ